jgi:hypothetical protein
MSRKVGRVARVSRCSRPGRSVIDHSASVLANAVRGTDYVCDTGMFWDKS